METRSHFRSRVSALTGADFLSIPVAPKGDLIGASILARRGGVLVVWVGYPTHEAEDGTHYYAPEQARRIYL